MATTWSPASPTTAATTRRRSTRRSAHVGYEQLRQEQAAARAKGRYLGIGVATYVEICGLGPSQVAGAIGFQGGLWESAIVRVPPDREGQRVHRRVTARPGRGDDVRADRGRRTRRRRRRREDRARRHRQHADGLGHLRQPHDRGRWRSAGRRDAKDQGEGQAARQRICSRPRSRTWITPTASSS